MQNYKYLLFFVHYHLQLKLFRQKYHHFRRLEFLSFQGYSGYSFKIQKILQKQFFPAQLNPRLQYNHPKTHPHNWLPSRNKFLYHVSFHPVIVLSIYQLMSYQNHSKQPLQKANYLFTKCPHKQQQILLSFFSIFQNLAFGLEPNSLQTNPQEMSVFLNHVSCHQSIVRYNWCVDFHSNSVLLKSFSRQTNFHSKSLYLVLIGNKLVYQFHKISPIRTHPNILFEQQDFNLQKYKSPCRASNDSSNIPYNDLRSQKYILRSHL